jgi:multidrug transporter EmrE-like cation transporter
MTGVTWLLLLSGVALNAAAQLLLKAATLRTGVLVSDSGQVMWSAATELLRSRPLWLGLTCYGISVLAWLGALSRVPVSIAYPMLSIGYVVNVAAAALLFGEAVSIGKLSGIGLIVAGVFILSRAAVQ